MIAVHEVLFTMQALYSFVLGVYAAWLGARDEQLSGNYWGSVAIYVILNVIVFAVGLTLLFTGHTIESGDRIGIYILYMLFLIVIMPGLFSILRGRDDRSAAIYFGVIAMFNAAVSYSMLARGLATWLPAP
jgi:hypothetical protein